jgi:hypothetical protein
MIDYTCRHFGPQLGQMSMASIRTVSGDSNGDRAVRAKADKYAKLLAVCTVTPTVLITIHASPYGRLHNLGARFIDMLTSRAAIADLAQETRLGRAHYTASDEVVVGRKRSAFYRRFSTTIQSSCAVSMFSSADWSSVNAPCNSRDHLGAPASRHWDRSSHRHVRVPVHRRR